MRIGSYLAVFVNRFATEPVHRCRSGMTAVVFCKLVPVLAGILLVAYLLLRRLIMLLVHGYTLL